MLSSKNLNDKTFEEVLEESIAQIPLYTQEWTNFNQSDPGITILENLSAFHILQQSEMNQVTDAVKEMLLKMVGFYKREGQASKILLKTKRDYGKMTFPAGQKLTTGDICFELEDEIQVNTGKILGIYSRTEGVFRNLSELTQPYGIPGGCLVFGERPEAGDSIYFVLSSLSPVGKQLLLYMDVPQEYSRSEFDAEEGNPFAKLSWEILTEKGYRKIKVKDESFCFMRKGTVRLIRKNRKGCIGEIEGMKGYVIRAVLSQAEYDIAPCVKSVEGFLTEAVQKDTKSVLLQYEGAEKITVRHAMAESPYFFVYVRENCDEEYYEYREYRDENSEGRYYIKEKEAGGGYSILFSKKKFAHAPMPGLDDGVTVVCCSEEMMLYRKLGKVCGYDRQKLDLSPYRYTVKEAFSLLLGRRDAGGFMRYSIWKPQCMDEDGFFYTINHQEAALMVWDCGDYEGADIIIGGCALYNGDIGNILPHNEFRVELDNKTYEFRNLFISREGKYEEEVEDVRKRFVKDLASPASMVTAQDCEEIIRGIPGLCIHKVKAFIGQNRNVINVVVKPESREAFPKLSDIYLYKIRECLDKSRMLNVKIKLLQPVYLPIHVKAVIYIKKHYEKYREKIEETLRQKLDFREGPQNFGELISFHEVYHALELLDCVEEIYELLLQPGSMQHVYRSGMDFKLHENCLCYPGNMDLELSAKVCE